MALLAAPTYNPANISNPVQFVFQVANANPLLYANAQLFVNGAAVSEIQLTPETAAPPVYTFIVDMNGAIADSLAPQAQVKTSSFGTLNAVTYQNSPDSFADLALTVVYFEADPVTGKPSNIGVTDTVPFGTYEALNATVQRTESLSLDPYLIAPRQFYTNSPNPYNICSTENYFLSFAPLSVTGIRVQTFDASGVLIDTGYKVKASQTTQEPFTIGAGVPQLSGLTYDSGAVNFGNPNVASYTITAGILILPSTFFNVTETKTFKLVECCERTSLRVHFLNRLGLSDAFTFTASKIEQEENNSKRGRVPLSWDYTASPPTNIYDRGAFKLDIINKTVYQVESKIYSKAEGAFIAELFSSPETYIETAGGLLPCIVKNASITTGDSLNLTTVKATIEIAVNNSIQQY